MRLDITRQSQEGFYIADVDFPSTMFCINHDPEGKVRSLLFYEEVNLAFYL